jgi:hypothetical protein
MGVKSNLDDPIHQTIVDDFINELHFRSTKTFNVQLLHLAFLLTLRGRADFRKSISNLVHPNSPLAFSLEKFNNRKPFQLNPPKYEKFLLNLEIDESTFESIEIETENLNPNFPDEEQYCPVHSEEESNINYHHDFDERPELATMNSAKLLINEIAPGMGLNPILLNDQFTNWIFNSIDDFISPQLIREKIGAFWRRLQITEEFEELAIFARRIFSIATSEAACERGFSKRKKTQDILRNRSKESLISARLKF